MEKMCFHLRGAGIALDARDAQAMLSGHDQRHRTGTYIQAFRTLAITAVLLAGTVSAQATLIDRGGGMIYDTTFNITWLADMNQAWSSDYAASHAVVGGANQVRANGLMGWDAANTWADNLVYGGFSDWRLPSANPNDAAAGELGHLFLIDLGNQPGTRVSNHTGDSIEQVANYALFRNVQSDVYWSGLEVASDASSAWYFHGTYGGQSTDIKAGALYATAVRAGDVAAVPEPQAWALMALGVGALSWARRRRQA